MCAPRMWWRISSRRRAASSLHCGLAWDDACLAFHQTERPVRSASMSQAREPIDRSSVGRWRPAPDLLAPLLDGLRR